MMWQHIKTYREFYIGIAWFLVFLWFFLIFVIAGFPGSAYDDCFKPDRPQDICWCEAFGNGNIKEPSNTWSNLGFVVAGLVILWWIGYDRAAGTKAQNRMLSADDALYPTAYGNIVLFMGPGSMLYHGSLKLWADVADQLSMFMFVAFFCSYSAAQLWSALKQALGYSSTAEGKRIEKIGASILFIMYTTLQMVMTRGGHRPSSLAIAIFVGFALLLQVVFITVRLASGNGWSYDLWGGLFFAGALGAFLLANMFHENEAPGESNCLLTNAVFTPHSWVQAHALWQLLAAVMTFGLYLYFRRENA